MKSKKNICPNCGAAILENEPNCPFCNFINLSGAEEKYLEDVRQVEKHLGQISEEQKSDLKKHIWGDGKIVAIVMVVTALVIGLVTGVPLVIQKLRSEGNSYDPKAEAIWNNQTYPMLDQLYAEGKYAEIKEFELSIYEINTRDHTNHSLHGWEHYEFLLAYSNYYYLKMECDDLDAGKTPSQYTAGNMIYSCLYFHYREYEKQLNALTKEDLAMLEEYRMYSEDVLYHRLCFTNQEIEEVYRAVSKNGFLDVWECEKISEKFLERLE